MKAASESESGANKFLPIFLVFVGVVLVWFAIVSTWITRNIFNQEVFVTAVSAALQSDQSRQVISETVVNRALEGRPLIKRAVGPTLTNTVSGILSSSQFQPVYDRAAQQVFIQLTTANPKPVEIDFQNAFTFVMPILEKLSPDIASRVENLPEKIVIIKPGQIPSIYSYGSFLSFFGPIFGVGGLILIGLMLWRVKVKAERLKLLVWTGVFFAGAAFVLNLMVPSLEMWMMAKISSEVVVTIVSQVFQSLIASFVVLTEIGIGLGLIVAIASFLFLKFSRRA